MLADDVEHLVDVVGGVDRRRQVALLRHLGRLAHQRDGAGLDLARHQDPADAVPVRALVAVDELQREVEFALARGFVDHAHELALVTADPAAAVEAWAEIGADAQFADDLEQRLLDAQLAPEFDERGDAVAQEFRDRPSRVEKQFVHHRIVVGPHVARIAADAGALAGDADFQKGLAEIIPASDIGDEPVRGAVTGMHVGVDEARSDQLVTGVDLAVDRALEALAHEQHRVAFVDQLGVAPQCMMPVGVRDQPATGDTGAHEIPFECPAIPYTDNFCCGKQPLR